MAESPRTVVGKLRLLCPRLLLLLLLTPAGAGLAADGVKVSGSVRDSAGSAVSGADVSLITGRQSIIGVRRLTRRVASPFPASPAEATSLLCPHTDSLNAASPSA